MDSPLVREQPHSAQPRAGRQRLGPPIVRLATIVPLLLLLLSALHTWAPQGHGFIALTQIFAPYLFFALVPLVPLLRARRATMLRSTMLVCLIVFCFRFGSSLVSSPPRAQANRQQLSALTWNLEKTNRELGAIRDVFAQSGADIVALQELTHEQAQALDADAELRQRYPHRVLDPRRGYHGMGLFSRYPLVEQGQDSGNTRQWVRLDVGAGTTLTVINAHPSRAKIRVPLLYDPRGRDAHIAAVRALAEPHLARGEPLLVLGDFNVTEREPTYRTLVAGLQDAHLVAGQGPGHSWRPAPLKGTSLGLLRIDYLLSSPQLRPLRVKTDCTPRGSDHCSVRGVFELQ